MLCSKLGQLDCCLSDGACYTSLQVSQVVTASVKKTGGNFSDKGLLWSSAACNISQHVFENTKLEQRHTHLNCQMEYFVDTQFCKLGAMLRSRMYVGTIHALVEFPPSPRIAGIVSLSYIYTCRSYST